MQEKVTIVATGKYGNQCNKGNHRNNGKYSNQKVNDSISNQGNHSDVSNINNIIVIIIITTTSRPVPSLAAKTALPSLNMGRGSSVGIATHYRLDGPGIESPWEGEIFRTRPDRPCGPPSLLYNGYRISFPGVKRPGRGADHPPPTRAEVKERVELYLYSPSGPSWAVLG